MTTSPLRVGVTGARGRMGAAVVEAVLAAPEMELAAALDIGDSLDELVAQSCDAVIDFTTPDAVMGNLEFAIGAGMHCVVGTTGFDDDRLARVQEWTAGHSGVGVLIAPNFSIGAVLMTHLSARAARYFESVEIVELHHPDKVDAPSGTAAHTAAAIAHARADLQPAPDATVSQLDGARGARVDDIPVHSIRLRGLVAHQAVLFGGPVDTLSIRHDSIDRGCFMPGVILAARRVGEHPGVTVGLADYLDL